MQPFAILAGAVPKSPFSLTPEKAGIHKQWFPLDARFRRHDDFWAFLLFMDGSVGIEANWLICNAINLRNCFGNNATGLKQMNYSEDVMLNYVWLGLIVIALIVAAVNGNMADIGKEAVNMSKTAVDISIGLIGIMALWLGVMRIAEEAGLIKLLARIIRPITSRLFPDVPSEHPAMGAMIMNIAANWLGLGNAATPLGIKAMEELQTLNPQKDTATNAMVLFLTLNTASITLIPATMIGVRVATGSQDPFGIIFTTIFASATATVVGVITAILLGKLPMFKNSDPMNAASEQSTETE